jgi:hypothetical protein
VNGSATPEEPTKASAVAPAVAALLSIATFYAVGYFALEGFLLDLGSLNFPTPGYSVFVLCWLVFGSVAAQSLALALSRRWGSRGQINAMVACLSAIPDRRLLLLACSAAFALPLCLRLGVLGGAPLTDDEGAYRFAAQLLASGRLWVPSPEMKLFFDQNFLINDGRLYPAYFLGWPAILAIGELTRATGLVNPVVSALSVPALLGVLRHLVGPAWAVAGILLFLSAPLVQIAAATQLSHTACLTALIWCLAMYLKAIQPDASTRAHAGFAFFVGLAFSIRPQSAVGIVLPLVVSWAFEVWRLSPGKRVKAALAFGVPSAVLATLFLGALWAQNGAPWRVGYAQYNQYIVMNGFRFTSFRPEALTPVPGFDFTEFVPAIARTASGMVRLNFDLFGWPLSFAFILFALPWRSPGGRLMWAMVASYLFFMLFQLDWGIDTFGPVHAFELTLPILILTVIAARKLTQQHFLMEQRQPHPKDSTVPAFLLVSLIACAWIGFVPVRLKAVHQIATHVNVALRAPENAGLHRAVIFAPLPFAPPCGRMPRHFVLFRPVNDPDLRNDILWVNHIDVESDRRFMTTRPGRTGYLLRWTPACEVRLLPLDTAIPADLH